MLGGKPMEDWVAQYQTSHQNRINQITHTFGIPMIVLSIVLALGGLFVDGLFAWAAGLFIAGWALQFIGHAFEGKPPEFFSDWRFLLVGTRWWFKKVTGKL